MQHPTSAVTIAARTAKVTPCGLGSRLVQPAHNVLFHPVVEVVWFVRAKHAFTGASLGCLAGAIICAHDHKIKGYLLPRRRAL
jgi:hypothetical protein